MFGKFLEHVGAAVRVRTAAVLTALAAEPLRAINDVGVVRGNAAFDFNPLATETVLAVGREGVVSALGRAESYETKAARLTVGAIKLHDSLGNFSEIRKHLGEFLLKLACVDTCYNIFCFGNNLSTRVAFRIHFELISSRK